MSGDGAAGVGTTGAGGGGVISARRIAEALDLPSPTEQQRRVIESPLEPGLVVAGAGSGKTETMASRVVWLLANGHVGVEEILGLTFTRKAAGELGVRIRARIEQLQQAGLAAVPADAFGTPNVLTYNAFANGIFRDSATLIGREAESVVLTEASAWQLARRLVVESTDPRLLELGRGVDPITQAVISLSRAMSENVADPAEVVRLAGSFTGLAELPFGSARIRKAPAAEAVAAVGALPPLVDLAVRFQEEKTRRGLVEYSDQVAFALAICERVPQVVAEHRKRFRVVLLDEYQDPRSCRPGSSPRSSAARRSWPWGIRTSPSTAGAARARRSSRASAPTSRRPAPPPPTCPSTRSPPAGGTRPPCSARRTASSSR